MIVAEREQDHKELGDINDLTERLNEIRAEMRSNKNELSSLKVCLI